MENQDRFKFNFLNDSTYEWMERAFCKNSKFDAQVFFPPRGSSHYIPKVIQETCNKCEVKAECLNYALENCIRHGIWGGTSERQRRKMRSAKEENEQWI